MDPSILSFERPASSTSKPPVPPSGDVSSHSESASSSLQSEPVELDNHDTTSPKYAYSLDALLELKDSPLVTCPELKEDTSAWIYSGYDNQQPKYRPNRREWVDKNGSHSAHSNSNNNIHSVNSSNKNRRTNVRESTDRRKKLPGFFDSDAQEKEPEWMESLEEPSGDNLAMMDMGKTVEEFEAWKAKMRLEEMKAAGIPIPEKREEVKNDDFTSASAEAPSVDRMFGMWGGSSTSLHSRADDIARPSSSAASKFSRFFSPGTTSGDVSASQASTSNSPQDQKSVPVVESSIPIPDPDADQQGFQRILQMLDSSNQPHSAAAPPQQKQNQKQRPPAPKQVPSNVLANSQHQRQQQPDSPAISISNNNASGNDLFFQSLLNKSGPPSETQEQKNGPERIGLSNQANQAASSSPNAPINSNMRMYPPPPPPGMMHHGPPPGMFENMPPLPPGMMFPPPPPPLGFDRSSAHPMFPPPPGFPPPFFGGNYPPPPMNGRPPRGQQPLDGNGQPLGLGQARDRPQEPR